ncbi:MAG: DUF3467 domain-containing protein [Planctomycetales bacterium]|nr:DUF3467 domain-containing protein [Planctomycetales bacterium]
MLALGSLSAPVAQEQDAPVQVQVDASQVQAIYANFSRVTGTTEEVIIDFGLNTQPQGVPREPIRLDARMVFNFYTAKRLLAALQVTIQRHEQAFGPIEVDVRKRLLKPT